MIVHVPERHDKQQLRDEFEAAGLTILSVERTGNSEFEVVFQEPFDPQLVDDIAAAHEPEQDQQLDALLGKARDVWNGTDSFTNAQAQKIIAGLAIIEIRKRQ